MKKTLFASEAEICNVTNMLRIPFIFYSRGKWREDSEYSNDSIENVIYKFKALGYKIA